MLRILLVDDEPATRLAIAFALTDAGHQVTEAGDGREAMLLAESTPFDVALCDVRLPGADGLTLLRHLRRESPDTAVIVMTAFADVADAVAALREGAFDYVTKPFDGEELTLRVIGRIAERITLRRELESARAQLVAREVGAGLVGESRPMRKLVEALATAAQSDANVVVQGEVGTGKKLVARMIHARSARRGGPLVMVDCASLAPGRVERALFGGASLDDGAPREGWLFVAHGGSLVLDGVDALPLAVQGRLVRALDRREGVPRGSLDGRGELPFDVRVVSLTTRPLRPLVEADAFREDLLYRLAVIELDVPPLRERRGDLPLLLQELLRRLTPPGMVPPGITPRAWEALVRYPFPGNVRAFAHAVERALVLAHGCEIDLDHLPHEIAHFECLPEGAAFAPLATAMKRFERRYVLDALHAAQGKRSRAAELLGITPKTLWEKLQQHGISARDLRD